MNTISQLEAFVDPTVPRAVYCDMDGVLVDFHSGFLKLYPNLTNVKELDLYLTSPGAWKDVGDAHPHLFRDLPKLPDADQLMFELFRLQREKKIHLHILTAIPSATAMPNARADKQAWIEKYYPEIPARDVHIVLRSQKKNFTLVPEPEPPAILIDDFKKNITEWTIAGGIGIQHRDAASSIRKLRSALKQYSIQYL